MASQEEKFRYLFEQLGVAGTTAMVERYVRPVPRSMPAPESLREALTPG